MLPGRPRCPPPGRPHPSPVADADLTFDQTGWGDSGVYYCSVVSAQDLQGNNEAYAELIVLGEWAWPPRAWEGGGSGTGAPSSATCVCLPSALCPAARSLDSVACFALPSWHHQSLGLLSALHPRQGPFPSTTQISQSHTDSGEHWGFYPFLVSFLKNLEILRVNRW